MSNIIRRIVLSSVLVFLASGARAAEGRRTIALDGIWQMAESKADAMPAAFDHQAPVPGLADMAAPPFVEAGVKEKDPRRTAFWYRRTFTLDGPVPAVAVLKIHKARYGTRVFLNGAPVGEHPACFTPGYFDLRPHLKGNGQANELTIRVGADRTAVPETIPWGHDYEKTRYIPGIYDSVELSLSGAPHIVRVQVAPDVPGKQARVQVVVRNDGPAVETTVACSVRPLGNLAGSGKAAPAAQANAGSAATPKLALQPGQEQTVELRVPIADCRLWSPEEPFLYELQTTTAADSTTTRFGMRSFAFDPKTKLPMLNGKPYYLRGTNICIDRFFEDPGRGDKPWREPWVRAVIRAFRSMHWNSCRYCIGFPPELWYRIADEEGLMIQDEFPVWGQTGRLEPLTEQYAEWMRERWNHPSVVIWDAQNETANQEITGQALTAVRSLDLSNRPWDNGWASPQAPTDVYEAHPYRSSSPAFRLSAFAKMSPRPGDPGSGSGNPVPNRHDNPIVINEYGWLWLNRDGSPTTLSVKAYESLLGEDNNTPQRRRTYARYLAAKTEFWRAGRRCAGVLHFCGLGYSRPGGQTSDNFIDIEQPRFEPNFFQYVRDAFAPVGLMIDFWSDELPAGAAKTQAVPVVVINDLDTPWSGPVRLRLLRDGKVLSEQSRDARVPPLGREVVAFETTLPGEPGRYELVAELRGADGAAVQSLRDLAVLTEAQRKARTGIAVGCRATASSSTTKDGQTYPCQFAVDGDPETRWSSDFSDPQWLAIDLGQVVKVSRVQLAWEGAFGKAYAIQVSLDGEKWTDVYKTDSGKGGLDDIRFAPTQARHVRYYGTERGTPFGHSLWEIRVFP